MTNNNNKKTVKPERSRHLTRNGNRILSITDHTIKEISSTTANEVFCYFWVFLLITDYTQ